MNTKRSTTGTCHNPACGKEIVIPLSQSTRKKYCSDECKYAGMSLTSIWDNERAEFVKANIVELGIKDVADKYGVTVSTLKSAMSKWRKSGIDIPNIRKTPIGTIVMKKVHGVPREYIMTENGLKRRNPTKVIGVNKARIAAKKKKAARVRADNKKTVIITTVKEVKVIKPPKRKSVNPCNHGKPPKPEVKKFATRVIDKTNTRTVRFNRNTEIAFVPNHISDEQAIANYAAKLAARVG